MFKTVEFVNADEIARGLSPLNPTGVAFQAGRIMLERIGQLISENQSFCFETTLSGLAYLKLISEARKKGYRITMFFVYLNNVILAKERVSIRVSKGGHSIPDEIIQRRYAKGLRSFNRYAAATDDWYIYDNSGSHYELVASQENSARKIINFEVFKIIMGDE